MVLSLLACGRKPEPQESTEEPQESVEYSVEENESTSFPDGDPAEYSREYWEAKYPGENICPFSIEENGIEHSYYWISGMAGWNGTMSSCCVVTTEPYDKER